MAQYAAYSVGMLRIIFIKDEWQDAPLLGRKVQDYMTRALSGGAQPVVAGDVGEAKRIADGISGDVAALPLSMPLISRDKLESVAARMRAKKLKHLSLGESGDAFIKLAGEGDGGFSVNDEAFFKIVDAKSFCMVYNLLRERIVAARVADGANVFMPQTVAIDDTVRIAAGANILPFSRIEGDSFVDSGASVSASYVRDSAIGRGASVEMSHVVSSEIGEGTTVGPFARLRGAVVAENCRVGDFVEIKASDIAAGTKAAHLAYIGDASVGERTNIGCGSVFCNYDGHSKHRTQVGKDCFIGANVNLVAPIEVGDGAFIAAGTTLTESVKNDTFSIGRSRQTTKSR